MQTSLKILPPFFTDRRRNVENAKHLLVNPCAALIDLNAPMHRLARDFAHWLASGAARRFVVPTARTRVATFQFLRRMPGPEWNEDTLWWRVCSRVGRGMMGTATGAFTDGGGEQRGPNSSDGNRWRRARPSSYSVTSSWYGSSDRIISEMKGCFEAFHSGKLVDEP
jgi:hypothetical protein